MLGSVDSNIGYHLHLLDIKLIRKRSFSGGMNEEKLPEQDQKEQASDPNKSENNQQNSDQKKNKIFKFFIMETPQPNMRTTSGTSNQPTKQWLSLSEFNEIYKDSLGANKNSIKLGLLQSFKARLQQYAFMEEFEDYFREKMALYEEFVKEFQLADYYGYKERPDERVLESKTDDTVHNKRHISKKQVSEKQPSKKTHQKLPNSLKLPKTLNNLPTPQANPQQPQAAHSQSQTQAQQPHSQGQNQAQNQNQQPQGVALHHPHQQQSLPPSPTSPCHQSILSTLSLARSLHPPCLDSMDRIVLQTNLAQLEGLQLKYAQNGVKEVSRGELKAWLRESVQRVSDLTDRLG